MRRSLRTEFTLLFVVLFAVILAVWLLFSAAMSRHIYQRSEQQISTTASQIVDALGKDFANLERVCYALSTRQETLRFIESENWNQRLAFAGELESLLNSGNYSSDLATHVLAISDNGAYYRLAGTLPNSSSSRLAMLTQDMELPATISVVLENTRYIGYATGIYGTAGQQAGALLMFVEEAELLDKLYLYSPENSLFIGIVADGQIIAANGGPAPNWKGEADASLVQKHIGITPFEIVVAADPSQRSASTYYFFIAAGVTILSFAIVLVVFARIQNKRLIAPMLHIMHSAEAVEVSGGPHALPYTNSAEFDRLVEKINAMLNRIHRQNSEIVASDLKLKNAEIAGQKAVIFALKKQINAHFTINTLHTVGILLESGDYQQADRVLSDLSAMIGYAYSKDALISVWDEMRAIERYVEIMNARYDNKIQLIFEVDDALMDVFIPRMLLQPLVENAISHGFAERLQDCAITISAFAQSGRLHLQVRDNGVGMTAAAVQVLLEQLHSAPMLSEGIENIALANIKSRLSTQFGEEHHMGIHADQAGMTVFLQLPL